MKFKLFKPPQFSSVERIHEYVRSIDIKRKLVAEYEA